MNTSGVLHAKHLLGPEPEQLEQLGSQFLHVEVVESKYWERLHVGRQRPPWRTGRVLGHDLHWLKEDPPQVLQSG